MALSIMAFAYGIAARFVSPDVEATRLKACIAHLEAENARLLDRLSVRLDELEAVKRQLAEARIERRLQTQPLTSYYAALGVPMPCNVQRMLDAQNAFANPWLHEVDCCGGGRSRYLKGAKGGA